MTFLELRILEVHIVPHFSLTCLDVLSWNFAYDFVLPYSRSRLIVCNLCQFLWESCPFVELKILEIHSFPLFICPFSDRTYKGMVMSVRVSVRLLDQLSVRISVRISVRVSGCSSVSEFSTLFSLHALTSSKYSIKFECLQFPSISVWFMPLLELIILEVPSFPHFSPICFDILSWNVAYDFALPYFRSSLSVVNLRQFLWEKCPFWDLE